MYALYLQSKIKFLKIYFLGIILLTLFRISFLIKYGLFSELSNYKLDLLNAFWVGFKFDTMVMTYFLLLPFVLNLSILFLPAKSLAYQNFVKRFTFVYSIIIFFLILIIEFIDFFYFKFFQSHINLQAFGIIDDDTHAVLVSVWAEYPVIKVILSIIILTLLLAYILKKNETKENNIKDKNIVFKTVSVLLIIAIYILGMRGSLGTFPLQNDDTTISPNSFVNSLTLNGIYALKDAYADLQAHQVNMNITGALASQGFSNPKDAISAYLDNEVSEQEDIQNSLFTKTPVNLFLKENPPNVVFIQMESMSNYYFDLHTSTLNLLGKLEKELPSCTVYRNFLSSRNGTILSLENLLINTPELVFSQSVYLGKPLSSSSALPFLNSGYHTNFITGAKLGWRNLDKFVPALGFQTVEGSSVILSEVKNAKECEWGVFDEFLFDRIYSKLENAKGKPEFVFAMSTTNHTPFQLPTTYKKYPVNISDNLLKNIKTSKEIAVKNFTNYQYANNCLGEFIERVKNSSFGENTIIVATGDHNTLQLFDFKDGQMLQRLSVPLILYIPEKYKKGVADTSRFGSHKDVFPTIFNLSLSDASYLKSGNNLLDTSAKNYFFGMNENTVMSQEGCVIGGNSPLFFKWENESRKVLTPTTLKETPNLEKLLNKGKAYKASMTYYIQSDLLKKK